MTANAAKRIRVSVPALRDIEYYEYLLTGFYLLHVLDEVHEFHVACDASRLHTHHQGLWWNHHLFEVTVGGKTLKVIVDVNDFPNRFDENAIAWCDLYFKCQCPKDYREGVYRLNSQVEWPLPPAVLDNLHKVRPLFIARPLSRRLDFLENIEMLKRLAELRVFSARTVNLLAYLGVSIDAMFPEDPHIHDVHFKRTMLMRWLYANRDELPSTSFIFRLPEHCAHLFHLLPDGWQNLPRGARMTDRGYLSLCKKAKATLNTCGIGGSTPMRPVDAWLTGMVCISDTFLTAWPTPPRHGQEFLSFGDFGFEVLPPALFDRAVERIRAFMENIDALRARIVPAQNAFYERHLAPEAMARYVLEECRRVL